MTQVMKPVTVRDYLRQADPQHQTSASGVAATDLNRQADQTISTIYTTEADQLRFEARAVTGRAEDLHRAAYMREWQLKAQLRAQSSAQTLLAELADLGFAWRDIARLVGVSVPAVQKWRKNGATTPENRQRLARLMAACDLVIRHRGVAGIGQWFEVPLVPGVPVTPLDLWADGQYQLVFNYALDEQVTAEVILGRYQPDWHQRYDSDFETFVADDGELSIRMRER